MQKRKGFTLVELVIVIAVIAILAGVLIGTFASVLSKAQESAKMQELKAQEHEQKADDLLKKIENSNWYGWEDFETSIVEKMTAAFKANASTGTEITTTDVQKAVKDALTEYAKNNAQQNTNLTEEQVKTIIEDAIGKIKFNGVTEAQVRAIVSAASTSIQGSQLSAAQVKSIVNAAQEKNLTANDVAKVIANANLATTTNVNSAVQTIISAIETASASALTIEDLANAIVDLLPVTYKVATPADLTKALASVNSFSTLNFTADFDATIEVSDNRTLTIAGVKLTNLTVNAPLATIYLVTDEGTVRVNTAANESVHISGIVDDLTVGKGRIVVEEEGKVEALTAAPTPNSVITVQVEGTVGKLTVELQHNTTSDETYAETVAVQNAGVVNNVVVSTDGKEDTQIQSTNVTVQNATASEGATAEDIAEAAVTSKVEIVVTDIVEKAEYTVTVDEDNVATSTQTVVDVVEQLAEITVGDITGYAVRTADELRLVASLVNNDSTTYASATYVLTADVDISDQTWTPIGQYKENAFAGKFYGQGYTISGMTNFANYEYKGIPEISGTSKNLNLLFGLFNFVAGGTIQDIKLLDVNVKLPDTETETEKGGGVGGGLVAYANYEVSDKTTSISGCIVSGTIEGFDCLGAIVGRANYTHDSKVIKPMNDTVLIDECVVTATIKGHRTYKNYCRVGAIIGFASCSTNANSKVTITGCTYTSATVAGRAGDSVSKCTNNLGVGGASNKTCCTVDGVAVDAVGL